MKGFEIENSGSALVSYKRYYLHCGERAYLGNHLRKLCSELS